MSNYPGLSAHLFMPCGTWQVGSNSLHDYDFSRHNVYSYLLQYGTRQFFNKFLIVFFLVLKLINTRKTSRALKCPGP